MHVIFNPTAAAGSVRRLAPDLKACLERGAERAGVEWEWVETQAPEHAIELAREAAVNGCEMVVAAGGDGTVNEVVNGLVRASHQGHQATLGVIPTGTGNDFAWLAGIPLNPLAACQRLFDGQTRVVDVGHIREANGRERYFDNGCGAGFDAVVSLQAQGLKKWLGGLVYIVAVLKTIVFHYHAPAFRMTFDGRELTRPTLMLTIGKGKRHGGAFLSTPRAEQDDGWLDVCIVGKLNRLGMLRAVPSFMRGEQESNPQVQLERARHVMVEASAPQVIHLDGEIFATDARRFEVSVVPGVLRVRV
jgi:YegS/Rv2252/BmrU family lipid kinase